MKRSSVLKKVTITAIVLTLAAMVLELIFVRALKLEYASPIFMPVRLITLISANLLGGCIFTKVINSAFLAKRSEHMLESYKKLRFPVLCGGAVLIFIDCIKDAFLHPETTTVSSALIFTYLLLAGICSLLTPKDDPSCDRVGYIGGAVVCFVLSVFAILVFTLSVIGDITYLFNR